MDFERQYLGEFVKPDAIYEIYYAAWHTYHFACEWHDRLISPDGYPHSIEQSRQMSRNARDMKDRYLDLRLFNFPSDEKKWQQAKMDALRDVEKMFSYSAPLNGG